MQSGRGRVSRPVDRAAPSPPPPPRPRPRAPGSAATAGDPRSRPGHIDRSPNGSRGRRGAVVDLLLGTAAGVASGHLRTDLPKEPPRDAELREPTLQQHVARDPSAASGNPSAFILSAPEPAPPLTNPFLQPAPGRRLQVSKGPGCGRGVCGGRAPVALATLRRQCRPPPPTDPVEN